MDTDDLVAGRDPAWLDGYAVARRMTAGCPTAAAAVDEVNEQIMLLQRMHGSHYDGEDLWGLAAARDDLVDHGRLRH